MTTVFEKELESLNGKILQLCSLVERSINNSVKSLVERDSKLAVETIDRDAEINKIEVEIDEECIRLIAIRQPRASDLRFITTAMKITTDLERIGDLTENICERAQELNEEPILKPYIDIPQMAEIAEKMLKDAIDAFVRRDVHLARNVLKQDDIIDRLNAQVFNELLFYMIQDPTTVSRAIKITYVSKYLERIADHATNIAEMVVYLVEGKIIRHMAMPEEESGERQ